MDGIGQRRRRHSCGSWPLRIRSQRFECERDTLTAADTQRNNPPGNSVATHRMKQSRGQDRPGGADRMPMRDGTAFDVDDVLRQAEVFI